MRTIMPIYEYKCEKCGNSFEHLARTISEPAPPCARCGSKRTSKQLSVFNAGSGQKYPCDSSGCPSGAGEPGGGCASGQCPFA